MRMPSADYARYERALSAAYRALGDARTTIAYLSNEGATDDLVQLQAEVRRLMDDSLRSQYPGRARLRS